MNKGTQKNSIPRRTNIELLRIIAMFMIIAHHFSVHSNFIFSSLRYPMKVWIQLLSSFGKIGVDLFIIISGYFLINSDKVSIKKMLKLLSQVFFYSISIFLIFVCTGIEPFKPNDLIKHILCYPVWWFVCAYIILYILHPYINKLLKSFSKKSYIKFLILNAVLWSVIPTIFIKTFDSGMVVWFVFCYTIGAFFNLYPDNNKITAYKYIRISLYVYIITFLSVIVFDIIGIRIAFFSNNATYLFGWNKFPPLIISIILFLGFEKSNIKHNKVINTISSTTFGIYLIHDCDYMKKYIWLSVIKGSTLSNSLLLIPYSIFAIITVFIICSIIELLRIKLLEKNYMIILSTISEKIEKAINKRLDSIIK